MLRLTSVLGLSFAVALASAPASSQTQPSASVPPQAAIGHELTKTDVDTWLDGFVPYAIKRGDLPGAVVVVVKNGEILTSRGFGYADVATHKPVDPASTLFRIGSVSKLFTWTSVMQLVEQGKLDLDADVNKYLDFKLPEWNGKPITLRNIMTHTAGFEESARYLVHTEPKPFTLLEVLKTHMPKQIYEPGTTPSYSNYATAVAGYIVQRVSGEDYDDYIEKHIFQPLDMKHITFRQPLPENLKADMSSGYNTGSPQAQPFEIIITAPAGSGSASGEDMAKFMISHLHHGAGLMKPETSEMMQTTAYTLMPQINRMELGFYEMGHNGHRIIGHGGDLQWFHTILAIMPDDDVGLFLSVNSPGAQGAAGSIRTEFVNEFVDRYFPATSKPEYKAIDAKESAEHSKLMAGPYLGSRRTDSTFQRASEFFGEQMLRVDGKGKLSFRGEGGGNGHWSEIAPFVWWNSESDAKIAAKVVDGKVVMYSGSPFTVSLPAPWYRQSSWIRPGTYAAFAALLLTALFWPISALVRRNYGATLALSGGDLSAYRTMSAVAALGVILFAGWGWLLASLSAGQLLHPTAIFTASTFAVEIATWIVVPVLLAVALWNAYRTWTGDRTMKARIWASLLVAGAFMLLWTSFIYNLFVIGE